MSDEILVRRPHARPARITFARLWRSWWLRATKAQQRQRLTRVLSDPHLARDLGLPVTERPIIRTDLW